MQGSRCCVHLRLRPSHTGGPTSLDRQRGVVPLYLRHKGCTEVPLDAWLSIRYIQLSLQAIKRRVLHTSGCRCAARARVATARCAARVGQSAPCALGRQTVGLWPGHALTCRFARRRAFLTGADGGRAGGSVRGTRHVSARGCSRLQAVRGRAPLRARAQHRRWQPRRRNGACRDLAPANGVGRCRLAHRPLRCN